VSDPWINRLVVSGPVDDVKAFAKAATGFEPPEFDSSSDKPIKTPLLFEALYDLLPAKAKRGVPEVEDEPAGLISERLVMRKNGKGVKIYRFELRRYEPDLLLTKVSKLFPRIVLILGSVAPNVDEALSKLIRNGTTRQYQMPVDRMGEIRTAKYMEWGEDCLDADIEADWVMLDEVVKYWDERLTRFKTHNKSRMRSQKRSE
jgi:hypothetical protein